MIIFILLVIFLIVCVMEFSHLKKQNNKIIEQNYLIINLLGEIKDQHKQ